MKVKIGQDTDKQHHLADDRRDDLEGPKPAQDDAKTKAFHNGFVQSADTGLR